MSRPDEARRPLRVLALPAFRKSDANPALSLLAEAVRRAGIDIDDWTPLGAVRERADIWHLHFPDLFVNTRSFPKALLGTLLFLATLLLARQRGTRILWTVHDLGSHDRYNPRLEDWFWHFLAARVDGFVVLDTLALPLARERFTALARCPGYVSDLGDYSGAYPPQPPRAEARRELGLPPDAVVLLSFGLIRHYKNLPRLMAAVRDLDDPNIVLVLAGRPFEAAIERRLRTEAATVPGCRLMLRWIPPREVSLLFAACDLVVLPYRRILNSGAARLAMTLGRPVLLPDLGLMRAQQQRFGAEWVRLYDGELTSAHISEAIAWARPMRRPAAPDTTGLDWRGRGREAAEIYRRVMDEAGPNARGSVPGS